MTYEEARILLEATATNLLGDSCSVDDEKVQKLMLRKYDAIDKAIEALEKQIPKKPNGKEGYNCGKCGAGLFNNDRYCWKCGQAIERSGADGR